MKSAFLNRSVLLLCTSFAIISCKKEDTAEAEAANATNTPQEIIVPRVQAIPGVNAQAQPAQQITMPPQNMPQAVAQAPAAAAPVAIKAGMNPPHGQPGHRCDIPVGASLSSPVKAQPKSNNNFTVTQNPTGSNAATITQVPTTPAILNPNGAATTTTAPGMNPPHGQPGHVCGTPVGSPLPKTTGETKTEESK